ncbi:MAG: 4Fe-4S dicluster domain-containing protein [Coriobacteriales bacterium]|jgi:molybdopterin-containing oxidoreductase family iron-sulfur binding subunit|nr:4Fe-4S dicluster domain-containing protein [Coriobacteriales bacterium]
MRYGMVIDTSRCVGCNACAVACKQIHGTGPGVFWNHVERWEEGSYPKARMKYRPVMCNHCAHAPCAEVCPVGATVVDENGIVTVDRERCMGCRYCIAACPYDARTFLMSTEGYYPELGSKTVFEEAKEFLHETGTVEKCILCNDRIAEGKEPACSKACPAGARTFGDLADPTSTITHLVLEHQAHGLQEDLGTGPSVRYIG